MDCAYDVTNKSTSERPAERVGEDVGDEFGAEVVDGNDDEYGPDGELKQKLEQGCRC